MPKNSEEDFELKAAFAVLDIADSISEQKDLTTSTTATVMYASVVEFLSEILIKILDQKINSACKDKYSSIIEMRTKNKEDYENNSHLGFKRKLLDWYEFPQKQEIMRLIKNINQNRNDFIHNLATPGRIRPQKNLDTCTQEIKSDTQLFINKFAEVLREINTIK